MVTLQALYEAVGGSTAVTVGLVWLEKKFGWIKPVVKEIEDHKGLLAEGAAALEAAATNLLHSPKVEELEIQLQHELAASANVKLVKLAGQVLQAAGKRLDALTPNQKTGFALVISTEAKKLGLNVSQSQIENAMAEADKAIDVIVALPLFQSTQAIDAPEEAPAQA